MFYTHRDAIIVTSLDTVTSLIAGITIFGILGNLAHNLNVSNIDEVVRSGTGLAFISYPDAIAKFEAVPQVIIAYTISYKRNPIRTKLIEIKSSL